ncbi:MAG: hypothetical protein IPK53_18040 [bacterium]|nr:hypothetical protein [bacterium]
MVFILLIITIVGDARQLIGHHPSLLNFIGEHPFMYGLTLYYLSSFARLFRAFMFR